MREPASEPRQRLVSSKEWKRKAWLLAVVAVLLFVVNPELRALVFLVDALSLEVFLLFVGLQVKEFLQLMQPAIVKLFASLVRPSIAVARLIGGAANALLPRVPVVFLAQQTLWAARMQLGAGVCRNCSVNAA